MVAPFVDAGKSLGDVPSSPMRQLPLALALTVAGCGRIGFDARANGGGDASSDGTIDVSTACGWCVEASPVPDDLDAVWGTSGGDVWAAGGGSVILHRDATSWTQ